MPWFCEVLYDSSDVPRFDFHEFLQPHVPLKILFSDSKWINDTESIKTRLLEMALLVEGTWMTRKST